MTRRGPGGTAAQRSPGRPRSTHPTLGIVALGTTGGARHIRAQNDGAPPLTVRDTSILTAALTANLSG